MGGGRPRTREWRADQRAVCDRLAMPRDLCRTTAIIGALTSELPIRSDTENIRKVSLKKPPRGSILVDLALEQVLIDNAVEEGVKLDKQGRVPVSTVEEVKKMVKDRVYEQRKTQGGLFPKGEPVTSVSRWIPQVRHVDPVHQREMCEKLARPRKNCIYQSTGLATRGQPTKLDKKRQAAHRSLCGRLATKKRIPAWQRDLSECSDSIGSDDEVPSAAELAMELCRNFGKEEQGQSGADMADSTPGHNEIIGAEGPTQSPVALSEQQCGHTGDTLRAHATSDLALTSGQVLQGKAAPPGTKGWMLAWQGGTGMGEVQQRRKSHRADLILGIGNHRRNAQGIHRKQGLFAWHLIKADVARNPDALDPLSEADMGYPASLAYY